MPYAKKKMSAPRKSAPRRRTGLGMRRRGYRKYSSNNVVGGPNTCKIVETLPTVTILANQGYKFDIPGVVGPRALAVVQQFALYRIAKVVHRFKPNFDTFTSNAAAIGGTGPVSVPTLYWKMNRFADAPAGFTSDNLRSLGSKPIRFDDKQVTVAYKPNILIDQATGGSHSGAVKLTPWLNTNTVPDAPGFAPSTTNHYGHFYLIECATAGNGTTPVGTVETTIIYEFKNPSVNWESSAPSTIEIHGYVSAGQGPLGAGSGVPSVM